MNNETHGLMSPEEIAARQELRQRVQERQEIMARQDKALREYREGPAPLPEPMVPLVAFILVAALCVVLIVAVALLSS